MRQEPRAQPGKFWRCKRIDFGQVLRPLDRPGQPEYRPVDAVLPIPEWLVSRRL